MIAWAGLTAWAAVAVPFLVGSWSPTAPDELTLTAALLAGLTYPFFLVWAIVGLLGAALLARARRWVATGAAALLSAAVAVAAATPTAAVVDLARTEQVPLSAARLLQGATDGPDAPAETVTYREVDGHELLMDVWLPDDPARAAAREGAAVVYVYGGGFVGGARDDMNELLRHLAGEGYTVFAGDYRLATADHPTADEAPGDVRCGLGWVAQNAGRYGVDPDRIVLAGGSAGANLAMMSAYDAVEPPADCAPGPVEVAALVDYYGPGDLTALHESSPSGDAVRFVEQYVGGTPEEQPARYRRASPLHAVGPGSPPTLILHGTRDLMVPDEQGRALAAALAAAGVPHRLLLLPGQQHGFDLTYGSLANQVALVEVDRFLDEQLG